MKMIYGFATFMLFNVFGTPILGALILPFVNTGVFIIIAIVYMFILTYLFKRWLDKQPL
jgi:membrane protein implicated in regulation of membrane protease activity